MTGAVTALLICIAGGIGAALRLLLDGLIQARIKFSYPIATTVINLTGSLVLGLLIGLATSQFLPHDWLLILGTGLLGGYTTFSTASFETVRLIEDHRYVAAIFNGLGLLIAGTAAAALGFAVALLLTC
jgi:CrcB protein